MARGGYRAYNGGLLLAFPFIVVLGPRACRAEPRPGGNRLFFWIFTDRQEKPQADRRKARSGLPFRVSGLEELFSHSGYDGDGLYGPPPSHSEVHRRGDLFYNGIGPLLRQFPLFPPIFRGKVIISQHRASNNYSLPWPGPVRPFEKFREVPLLDRRYEANN